MQDRTVLAVAVVGVLAVGLGVAAFAGPPAAEEPTTTAGVTTFESETAFQSYVQRGTARPVSGISDSSSQSSEPRQAPPRDSGRATAGDDRQPTAARPRPTQTPVSTASGETRVGETNVQVAGVDEPDLVKTDGERFFYAPAGRQPASFDSPYRDDPQTTVVDIDEPATPRKIAAVNRTGTLLRTGDRLVVLADEGIVGYDVSDPSAPRRAWSRPLDGSLETARAVDGRLYLVTASPVDSEDPCPIAPLGNDTEIACTDVHRPTEQVSVDVTYTALSVDLESGSVTDTASFVGSRQNTVVYATADQLYLTYTKRTDRLEVVFDVVLDESDVVPSDVKSRLREIRDSDRTRWEKFRAGGNVFQNWTDSLSSERRASVRKQLRADLQNYVDSQQRTLTRTGIVRVSLGSDLSVAGHGTVAGEPLNQFSLGTHEGTLRITTTVPGFGARTDSENDLYVLDGESLDRRGAVTGMGVTEEVYSVRYVDDTAYVVTFRRIDPFHVVDLSDPTDPEEVGVLELPGFSSYLHPLDEGRILGIGREDGQVKAVIFDVSDPAEPTVEDDLLIEERWSGIENSHHAFTLDRKHGVFFLPTGGDGLIVEYTEGDLSVVTRVETPGETQRARYVGDYLYVFGTEQVVVVDETTWERVATLPV